MQCNSFPTSSMKSWSAARETTLNRKININLAGFFQLGVQRYDHLQEMGQQKSVIVKV